MDKYEHKYECTVYQKYVIPWCTAELELKTNLRKVIIIHFIYYIDREEITIIELDVIQLKRNLIILDKCRINSILFLTLSII